MPTTPMCQDQSFDDDKVGLRVEPGAQAGDDFVGDAALDLLALAVLRVQGLRDGQRLGEVAGQQQAQGILGGFQAAGGIEPGRELEPDFVGAQQRGALSDPFQGDQPGPLGRGQALQAGGNQDPVFAGQRDDVGNGAQRDQVEQGAQVEVGGARQARFASALDQGVGEFEGEADGAEFGEGAWTGLLGFGQGRLAEASVPAQHGRFGESPARLGLARGCCSELGIDQGDGGRRRGGNLMMVQHDHVHAALAEPGDGGDGGRAAVHGEQQRHGELPEAILHAILAEAVAFVHAMRQVVMDLPAERAQHFEQQGGRGDAVHVVIAEDDERLVALAGLEQALDGGRHVRQQERIGQVLEPGLEEAGDGRWLAQAAIQEALGEQRRDLQAWPPAARRARFGQGTGTSGISSGVRSPSRAGVSACFSRSAQRGPRGRWKSGGCPRRRATKRRSEYQPETTAAAGARAGRAASRRP